MTFAPIDFQSQSTQNSKISPFCHSQIHKFDNGDGTFTDVVPFLDPNCIETITGLKPTDKLGDNPQAILTLAQWYKDNAGDNSLDYNAVVQTVASIFQAMGWTDGTNPTDKFPTIQEMPVAGEYDSLTPPGNPPPGPGDTGNAFDAAGKIIGFLVNPETWLRLFLMFIGGGLLIYGLTNLKKGEGGGKTELALKMFKAMPK